MICGANLKLTVVPELERSNVLATSGVTKAIAPVLVNVAARLARIVALAPIVKSRSVVETALI